MTTRDKVVEAQERLGPNISAIARELKVSRTLVRRYMRQTGVYDKPEVRGRVHAPVAEAEPLPAPGKVSRYILTSAQNNTHLHAPLWSSLTTLAEHYNAQIWVSTFSYDRSSYGVKSVKRGTEAEEKESGLWYDERILPFIRDARIEIAPGLIWCGETNIIPSAQNPLSGFENYTHRDSGIFPHAKFAMQSIPSGRNEGTKFNYTTGTVTQRNYIQKKAGQKAEFHHAYGALLVEVDSDGSWFVRQLNSDKKGTIYDLDIKVQGKKLTTGNRVEAITWGDFHSAHLDWQVADLSWGRGNENSMIDVLRPKKQFIHDLLDFYSRNHHDRDDPHRMFLRHVDGMESVETEVRQAARILSLCERPWCQTIVVDSNHDNALGRWLKEADYREDPLNAEFFLTAQREVYRSIREKNKNFHLIEWAMRNVGVSEKVRFLREDESFIICDDIECGMHGHLGPNGSRGTPRGLSRLGRRVNSGHTHSAEIRDGIYVAGTSSKRSLGYTKGPSSWSHSHIITYANGKRAIVTIWKGKSRA